MPTPEEISEAVGDVIVFNRLDLRSGYYQLSIRGDRKHKLVFWGIDENGKDQLYQWRFLPFGLKNAQVEFQCVMN